MAMNRYLLYRLRGGTLQLSHRLRVRCQVSMLHAAGTTNNSLGVSLEAAAGLTLHRLDRGGFTEYGVAEVTYPGVFSDFLFGSLDGCVPEKCQVFDFRNTHCSAGYCRFPSVQWNSFCFL
jgi:hypothetical protein